MKCSVHSNDLEHRLDVSIDNVVACVTQGIVGIYFTVMHIDPRIFRDEYGEFFGHGTYKINSKVFFSDYTSGDVKEINESYRVPWSRAYVGDDGLIRCDGPVTGDYQVRQDISKAVMVAFGRLPDNWNETLTEFLARVFWDQRSRRGGILIQELLKILSPEEAIRAVKNATIEEVIES